MLKDQRRKRWRTKTLIRKLLNVLTQSPQRKKQTLSRHLRKRKLLVFLVASLRDERARKLRTLGRRVLLRKVIKSKNSRIHRLQ